MGARDRGSGSRRSADRADGWRPSGASGHAVFAVQAVEEGQVRIEPRLVEWPIDRGERERVFAIVEVAKLDTLRARIAIGLAMMTFFISGRPTRSIRIGFHGG